MIITIILPKSENFDSTWSLTKVFSKMNDNANDNCCRRGGIIIPAARLQMLNSELGMKLRKLLRKSPPHNQKRVKQK